MESLAEKIETGRYGALAEIDDLVACTMVIPSLLEENDAIEYCQKVFSIHEIKRRAVARKSPDLFRFDATRLYGFIVQPDGLDEVGRPSIYSIKFEIQIRTAFEHAWIVSTHPLTYKSNRLDWKRFRLAAQIKATSEQLDLLIVQFEQLAAAIPESPWPELSRKQEIVALIEGLLHDGVIPSEAAPKDMSRFADNLATLVRASQRKLRIEDVLRSLDKELRSFTSETFPRSASLLQVCVGVLCEGEVLAGPLERYTCHVTEQLVQLFPRTGALTPVFNYKTT